MNLKEHALPGDILLFKVSPRSNWFSRLVAIAQLFRGEGNTFSEYSHAALVSHDTNLMIEAVFPKSRFSLIDWETSELELWRINNISLEKVTKVLNWACQHIGCWYDIGQLVFGLFRFKNTYSCAEFVGNAFLSAQIDLISQAGRFVGPNELIESGLIDKVI